MGAFSFGAKNCAWAVGVCVAPGGGQEGASGQRGERDAWFCMLARAEER